MRLRLDQRGEVTDDDIGCERKIFCDRSGLTKTALIVADHPVAAREMRHPRPPRLGVLGEAVHEHHRLGMHPSIGVIVDPVEQFAAGQLKVWHGSPVDNALSETLYPSRFI